MTKTILERLLKKPSPVVPFDDVPVGAVFRLVSCKYDNAIFQKTAADYGTNCERYWIGSISNQLCHEEDCCKRHDLCVIIK